MSGTRWAILYLLAAAIATSACGGIIEIPNHNHGCTVGSNSKWNSMNLRLDHSASEACTMDHYPEDPISTSATVTDDDAVYPSNGNSISLETTVFDSYNTNTFTGYVWLGSDFDFFTYNLAHEWEAQGDVSYISGDSPDTSEHIVLLSDDYFNPAIAWIRVDFQEQDTEGD